MIGSLNALLRASYSQTQLRNPVHNTDPASKSEQERAASMGFYPDSQIPAVVDKQQSEQGKFQQGDEKDKRNFDTFECQTCKNRKYQDGSNDPGVSFKTPTNIAPEQAASSVRAHENEHVVREQAKAEREGRKVVSQNVSYQSGICPECGKVYVAGGKTRTVTKAEIEDTYNLNSGSKKTGRYLDLVA